MGEEYSDGISFNNDTEITMTIKGDFTKLFEVLGIEVPKKKLYTDELKEACDAVVENLKSINRIMDKVMTESVCRTPLVIRVRKEDIKNEDVLRQIGEQETADLKAACDVVERHNKCFTSPTEFCRSRACKVCEYHEDVEVVRKAVNQLLDHTKKSLNCGDEVNNRYIRNVTGGVELYDYSDNYVGYVHGFMVSDEGEARIRSIVQNSWGLMTFNPHTLEKIVEDHGYISDVHFLVELYKNPSDIELPEEWRLVKRKTKEDSK